MGRILIVLAVIVLGAGWIVWRRWHRGQADATPVTPAEIPRATLAQQAFVHGNSCLAEGKFAEAIAAFDRARELNPKHPHVAARLAEVARQQQAARAPSENSERCGPGGRLALVSAKEENYHAHHAQ